MAEKMSFKDRMLKTGHTEVIKNSNMLADSILGQVEEVYPTQVHGINIALGGSLKGGLTSGILMIAGPSKHFKSLFGLIACKAYMDAHKDAIMLFYDNEFGASLAYFDSIGIDKDRVIHIPFSNIEELKSDMAQKTNSGDADAIKHKDKVCIFIDSIGNAASIKEINDTESEAQKADMTRAKSLKSMWRIIMPRLKLLDIPLVCINHTYLTQDMFPKAVVGGGTGGIYNSNDIWIIGKSQEKDGTELLGFTFTINIEKSRKTREKAKIPLLVRFDGGLSRNSGLLDIAIELGVVTKPTKGWMALDVIDPATGVVEEEIKFQNANLKDKAWNDAFYEKLLNRSTFAAQVEAHYALKSGKLLSGEEEIEVGMDSFAELEDAE